MHPFRAFAFAAGLLFTVAGCGLPPILDRAAFCEKVEALSPHPGGRTVAVFLLEQTTASGTATHSYPYGPVDVTVTEVGGVPGDSNQDLRVCAGDCVSAPDSAFTATTTVKVSDDGVLVYTVLAGTTATGSVLIDFGTATCLQEVK